MKNNKLIYILVFIGIIVTMFTSHNIFFNDNRVIKENFGVDLYDLKLQEINKNEEWSPNGDGVKIQIFEFENNYLKNTKKLNKLPVKEKLPINEVPKEFLKSETGYYKYIVDKKDSRNFNILIIDTLKKKICVYCQIM